MTAINQVFDQPGAAFVLLRSGIKFPPMEKEWQAHPHTFAEATGHNGNVGVMAGNGHLGLDQDDPEAFVGIELPITTTWASRPGRLGMRFTCKDRTPELLAKYGKKADHAQFKLFKDGKAVGEVKLERTYQVIPPSWKNIYFVNSEEVDKEDYQKEMQKPQALLYANAEQRYTVYKMLKEVSPAETSLEWLLSELVRVGITFTAKANLDKNAATLESMVRETRQKRAGTDEQSARKYAEAALNKEVDILASTAPGSRNDQLNKSAFALGQFVGAGVLSRDEVVSALVLAAGDIGIPDAEMKKTIDSGLSSGMLKPRDIPAPKEAGLSQAQELLKGISDKARTDATVINDPEVIKALAYLKRSDPVEFAIFLDGLGLKRDVKTAVKKAVDKIKVESKVKETTQPDVVEAARKIIADGRGYDYICEIWQKRNKGNPLLGQALVASRGCQSCTTTKGLHILAHGKHGQGKSHGMGVMAGLVHPLYMMDDDVSPLAIYYANKDGSLLAGTTLFMDDPTWNDAIGGLTKRVTTKYQQGAGHATVIDGEYVKFLTAPRLGIWTNSADLQVDEQNRDRFFDVPVDEDQTNDIIGFQKTSDTRPDTLNEADKETAICHEIFKDLAEHVFAVRIPFAEDINFPTAEGTRGYAIFSDLIQSFAALRYAVRKTDERGYLLAELDDYERAKEVYEGVCGHGSERYGVAETKVLQAIIDNGYKATVEDISKIAHISSGRIREIIYGRGKDEQKRHGLLYKCSKLEAETIDMSFMTSDGTRYGRHPKEFSLPKDFKLETQKRELISLRTSAVAAVPIAVTSAVGKTSSCTNSAVAAVVNSNIETGTVLQHIPPVDLIPNIRLLEQNPTATTAKSRCIAKTATAEVVQSAVEVSPDSEKALQQKSKTVPLAPVDSTEGEEHDAPEPDLECVRVAARMEYGANGVVDPGVLSVRLGIQLEPIIVMLLELGYQKIKRQNGELVFKQPAYAPKEVTA